MIFKLYGLTQDGFKFIYETTDEASIDNDLVVSHSKGILVWKVTVNDRG